MLATQQTATARRTKPKKWDKLDIQLENFVRNNLNEKGEITKSLSELFKEFAKTHNTTVGSTSFYYYNSGIRERVFGSDESTKVEEVDAKTAKKDVNEIDRLIQHIEESLNINVSEESASMIEEMVRDNGVVETILSISKAIANYDKLDMSYILIKEAKLNL